ncbi:hypothetical protein LRB11_14785 [Ectothiorhodospira haloalkaliphila]|uniref:hypothetical protein n=1 Tax=Ectothiorhodospira haloalkaliphila TaxID=421628 RepID=UPI001EE87DF5|nr:hypothetical protein [Ectothiorhodospira haloalkaliphila]MCG5526181.1 hypothetical protein [Ectothiorhodospira haloalkaliphila]
MAYQKVAIKVLEWIIEKLERAQKLTFDAGIMMWPKAKKKRKGDFWDDMMKAEYYKNSFYD